MFGGRDEGQKLLLAGLLSRTSSQRSDHNVFEHDHNVEFYEIASYEILNN